MAVAKPQSSPLLAHFVRVEESLLAQSKLAYSSGHSVHQGTVRETFIREFLGNHVAERLGIGTGEVISADSKDGEGRNQLDVVVYSRGYPKLHIGGSISMYLVESVIAVLEIKTTLDKDELRTAIKAACRIKELKRVLRPTTKEMSEWLPRLLYYVIAYGGYETLDAIHKAIVDVHSEEQIQLPAPVTWKGDGEEEIANYNRERIKRVNPSIDGVLLIGKGYVQFDNANSWFIPDEMRKKVPDANWEMVEAIGIGLHHLYMNLIRAADTAAFWILDPKAYEGSAGLSAGAKLAALVDKPKVDKA